MADQCGFLYTLVNRYFKYPDEDSSTKSLSSELPDGEPWLAKFITGTVIYAIVRSGGSIVNRIQQLYSELADNFNLYTSVDLLSTWEKSVGLPDPRVPSSVSSSICYRRKMVKRRINKNPIVRLEECQDEIDSTFPDYGIWLETKEVGNKFRYKFRYKFQHWGGNRDRWIINVNIPWIAIDESDLENSPMTWENLQNWLRDFFPSPVMFKPIYITQASYCVITYPQNNEKVYISHDGSSWSDISVKWKQIDTNGTVVNHIDTNSMLPTTTEITKSFTDSTVTLIEDTNTFKTTAFLN